MDFQIIGGNKGAEITLDKIIMGDILEVSIDFSLSEEAIPEKFTLRWYFSAKDCAFTWNPSMMDIHGLYFDWGKKIIKSRLASWMPIHQII